MEKYRDGSKMLTEIFPKRFNKTAMIVKITVYSTNEAIKCNSFDSERLTRGISSNNE
jgi:hypothetical protein